VFMHYQPCMSVRIRLGPPNVPYPCVYGERYTMSEKEPSNNGTSNSNSNKLGRSRTTKRALGRKVESVGDGVVRIHPRKLPPQPTGDKLGVTAPSKKRADGSVHMTDRARKVIERARERAAANREGSDIIILPPWMVEIHYHSGMIRRFESPRPSDARRHAKRLALEASGKTHTDTCKHVVFISPEGKRETIPRSVFLSESESAWVAREHAVLADYKRPKQPVMKKMGTPHGQRCKQSKAKFSKG